MQVLRGDCAMRSRVLLGIVELVRELVHRSGCGHGGQRGAPVVGRALIVAASLLVPRREPENSRIVGETIEGLAQPHFSLRLVIGRQRRANRALKIS